mmetsp:Transcript_46487/g.85185  ORF Transcript_46487/g.85185 Transcript_46487/m.85185 type:complete len:688 (+) Transcript_46487:58-2121(+)
MRDCNQPRSLIAKPYACATGIASVLGLALALLAVFAVGDTTKAPSDLLGSTEFDAGMHETAIARQSGDGTGRYFLNSRALQGTGAVDENGLTLSADVDRNQSLVRSPLSGLIFVGWPKDTWGGAFSLQVGDRVSEGSPLLLVHNTSGSDPSATEQISSPMDGVVVQMADMPVNTQLVVNQSLVVLEYRPSTSATHSSPVVIPNTKQQMARTKHVGSTIGDRRSDGGWPAWIVVLLGLLLIVLLALCAVAFFHFISSENPCSDKDVETVTYQDGEQAALLDGISRAARDSVSEAGDTRAEMFQPGMPIEFQTKDGRREVIRVFQRPLGMKFYKSWWKGGLKVAGFTKPSHAQDQGVETGWTIVAINGEEVGSMDYKDATEMLKKRVEHLPLVGSDEDAIGAAASLGTAGSLSSGMGTQETFARLPPDQVRLGEESRQTAATSRSQGSRSQLGARSQGFGDPAERTEEGPQAPEAVLLLGGSALTSSPHEPAKEGTWTEAADQPPAAAAAPAPDRSDRPPAPESSFPILDARRGEASTHRARFAASPEASGATADTDSSQLAAAPARSEANLELEFMTSHNKRQLVKVTHRPLGMLFYKSFWKNGLKVAGFKKGVSHARDVGVEQGWVITRAGDRDLSTMKYKEAVSALKDAVAHLPMIAGEDVEDDSSGTDSSRGSSPEPKKKRGWRG